MGTNAISGWTVAAVLQLLGCPAPDRKGFFHCPSPDHLDTHPSAHITKDGRGWKCFSCEATGGILDLVVNLGAAKDEKDAAKFLEKVS